MANLINTIQCSSDIKNTGICDCFFDPKNPLGMIFVPKDFKLTESDIANIQTFLEAKTRAAKGSRIYPVQNFISLTDGTEDATVESFAYGQKETVREGIYSWSFVFRKGGVSLSNKLRTFNGKESSFSVVFFDAQNALYASSITEANGSKSIVGITLSRIYAAPWKVNDGTKNSAYMINVEFSPTYINEKLGFVKIDAADYLLTELNGLQDLVLSQAAAPAASGVFTVAIATDCGENLFDTYGALLVNPSLWVATNKTTGAAINVTSVVANSGLKVFTVTLDTADTDYPATVGLPVEFTLVDSVSLATANIVGFEAGILTQNRA